MSDFNHSHNSYSRNLVSNNSNDHTQNRQYSYQLPSDTPNQRPSTESLLLSISPYSQLSLRRQLTNSFSNQYRRRLTANQHLRAASYNPDFVPVLSSYSDIQNFSTVTPSSVQPSSSTHVQPQTPKNNTYNVFNTMKYTNSPFENMELETFSTPLSTSSASPNPSLFTTPNLAFESLPVFQSPLPLATSTLPITSDTEFIKSVSLSSPQSQKSNAKAVSINSLESVSINDLIQNDASKFLTKNDFPAPNSKLSARHSFVELKTTSASTRTVLLSASNSISQISDKKLKRHSSFPDLALGYSTKGSTAAHRKSLLLQHVAGIDSLYFDKTEPDDSCLNEQRDNHEHSDEAGEPQNQSMEADKLSAVEGSINQEDMATRNTSLTWNKKNQSEEKQPNIQEKKMFPELDFQNLPLDHSVSGTPDQRMEPAASSTQNNVSDINSTIISVPTMGLELQKPKPLNIVALKLQRSKNKNGQLSNTKVSSDQDSKSPSHHNATHTVSSEKPTGSHHSSAHETSVAQSQSKTLSPDATLASKGK